LAWIFQEDFTVSDRPARHGQKRPGREVNFSASRRGVSIFRDQLFLVAASAAASTAVVSAAASTTTVTVIATATTSGMVATASAAVVAAPTGAVSATRVISAPWALAPTRRSVSADGALGRRILTAAGVAEPAAEGRSIASVVGTLGIRGVVPAAGPGLRFATSKDVRCPPTVGETMVGASICRGMAEPAAKCRPTALRPTVVAERPVAAGIGRPAVGDISAAGIIPMGIGRVTCASEYSPFTHIASTAKSGPRVCAMIFGKLMTIVRVAIYLIRMARSTEYFVLPVVPPVEAVDVAVEDRDVVRCRVTIVVVVVW
jgi:hypothetical protein